MTLANTLKAFAAWLGILVLAIANGVLRETVFIPAFGQSPGLLLSGVSLSGLIFAVAYFALPWFGRMPVSGYVGIGIGWCGLTLLFEFIFGRIIQGLPWPQLLEAYRFKEGNIWPVVLLVTAAAPYGAARIKGWV